MDKKSCERVLCAAVYVNNSIVVKGQPENIKIGYVLPGYRHSNCLLTLLHVLSVDSMKDSVIQGFLTSKNRFVTREEAAKIAFNSGQIVKTVDSLFSEDLY